MASAEPSSKRLKVVEEILANEVQTYAVPIRLVSLCADPSPKIRLVRYEFNGFLKCCSERLSCSFRVRRVDRNCACSSCSSVMVELSLPGVCFENLLLLGFGPVASERKNGRSPLHPSMFDTANKPAMQVRAWALVEEPLFLVVRGGGLCFRYNISLTIYY